MEKFVFQRLGASTCAGIWWPQGCIGGGYYPGLGGLGFRDIIPQCRGIKWNSIVCLRSSYV